MTAKRPSAESGDQDNASSWTMVEVGTLARFSSGDGISVASLKQESSDFAVPVYGGNGVAGYTTHANVDGPTVIVGRVGQRCGEVHIAQGRAFVTDNALFPSRVLGEFDIKFFGLALDAARLNDVKNRNDLPLVTQSILHAVRIPWPVDIDEQRAIAAALSDVDALIAALDRLIAKKRDLKQAAMQQLLTGQTRLPGFSGEWESELLGRLDARGAVRLGRGNVISKKDIARVPGEHPIYSSSVQEGGLFGRYGRFMFDEEMITWSVDGGGHFFYRPKHRFSVTNVCGYMRVDSNVFDYRFLASQLQHLHGQLRFDYQDKAHPSVIRGAYLVLVPPVDEQTAIATVLSDMDAEITALEARRDKTRLLKQGMMQELLTGRTRLV